MAHGMGVPVADAETEVEIPEAGRWTVWAYSRNWNAVWPRMGADSKPIAAGRFQVLANGMPLTAELGTGDANWHWTKAGEIDLILKDGDTIVFAEVKTRKTGEPGNGLSAVNPAKQKRIAQAATIYLMQKNRMRETVRFDLVEICGEEILYVPNAFQPYGRLRI